VSRSLDIDQIAVESIELASAVNHAVDASCPLVESKGLDLTVSLPPRPVYLNADPTRLAQVVGNLLNNACKFTGKGGHIWLTAELTSDGDSSPEAALIRVQDTGIGLPADQLERIFDLFDTSLERAVSGLGIGLTLAKNLVELHGGTLEAHSAGPGQGSEFVVRRFWLKRRNRRRPSRRLASRKPRRPAASASLLSMTTRTRQSLSQFC